MTTDLPMFTRSLSIRRGSACWATGALGCTLDATGAAGVGWLVGLTASSRFHIEKSSALRGPIRVLTPACHATDRDSANCWGREPTEYIGRSKFLSSDSTAGTRSEEHTSE